MFVFNYVDNSFSKRDDTVTEREREERARKSSILNRCCFVYLFWSKSKTKMSNTNQKASLSLFNVSLLHIP